MISPALNRFCVITALATLCLIALGGLVTSHGAGLAVPDWPNSYGYNMFFFPVSHWVGGIFYEHTHRLMGSLVGLLTGVLALWLHGKAARPLMRWLGAFLAAVSIAVLALKSSRWPDAMVLGLTGLVLLGASWVWPASQPAPRYLRRMGIIAFIAVVIQGVLGGLRVTAMKDELGILHATLAQLFFTFVCVVAVMSSRWFTKTGQGQATTREAEVSWNGSRLFVLGTGLILTQLVLGAAMRHQHAGLAIPDFPLAYGRIWPDASPQAVERYNSERIEVKAANPITSAQIYLQMAHRLMALAIVAVVGFAAWQVRSRGARSGVVTRLSFTWVGLIMIQVGLGAATIWSNKAADIATAHVIIGALSLATGTILSIVSVRLRSRAGQSAFEREDRAQPQSWSHPPAVAGG